jgi:hypothetical protein
MRMGQIRRPSSTCNRQEPQKNQETASQNDPDTQAKQTTDVEIPRATRMLPSRSRRSHKSAEEKKEAVQGMTPSSPKLCFCEKDETKMKQEAKKLSSEVKIENRRRVRLGRLADKLSDTDLCNLLQQRGLNTGGTGSQSTSRPNDIRK